jgi:mRNA-degrading endonuclease RelE of RelBE toxin-antitoxin system
MPKRLKFTLTFASEAIEHLDRIESKYHGLLLRTIEEQLTYTPTDETRNRKILEQPAPFDASWELPCGPNNCFRVFYAVDSESHVVWVLAVGTKDRSRLLIGEEEYES